MSIYKLIGKMQADKIFNTSEKIIKEWIAKFLGKDPAEVFDMIPDVVEPVLFCPSEISHGKYVELKLSVVDSEYSLNIDELLQEKLTQDTIQFFILSVRIVYGAVMKTTARCDAHDITLEWNADTMTFIPESIPDPKKKKIFFNHVLGCMMNAKDQLPAEQMEKWEADFVQLTSDIEENNEELAKIEDTIKEKNVELMRAHRIGILCRYLDEVPPGFVEAQS